MSLGLRQHIPVSVSLRTGIVGRLKMGRQANDGYEWTMFLATDENPTGYKLEDLLALIRKDLILQTTKIVDDNRVQARQVLENDIRILGLLSDCIGIAEQSSQLLQKSFGPHRDGQPRIGSV